MKIASTNKRAGAATKPIRGKSSTESWWITIPGRLFVLGPPYFGRVGQWDKCLLRQYYFVLNAITYYNGGLLRISEAD